jgi:hypothetical protein
VICGNCFGTSIVVQMRARIMNQLQAVAMNEGYRWKKKLFSEQGRALLEKLSLAPWASCRTHRGDRVNTGAILYTER